MKFGLIGYPLTHSFSKSYFNDKFKVLGLSGFSYENFPLSDIGQVSNILQSDLFGLNVTLPYKSKIIEYLNEIDIDVVSIGAVNTLVRKGTNAWKGYNTDASGFRESFLNWIDPFNLPRKALILGSGGASKAVLYVLESLGIEPTVVSRIEEHGLTYHELTPDIIKENLLIVNTTPLGMDPDVTSLPGIPYDLLTSDHWLYDLVYNPANTLFLARGQQMGAKTKNGLEMLYLQAEHAWAIWKSYGKF